MQLPQGLMACSASGMRRRCEQRCCVSTIRKCCERGSCASARCKRHGQQMRVTTACIRHKVKENAGQGTVEYALVLAALLVIVLGLGVIAHLFTDGSVANHALVSASHHVSGSAVVATLDIFAF